MLGKLIKHELKAMFSYMLPIYIGLFIAQFLFLTINHLSDLFAVITLLAYFFLIFAALIAITYYQAQIYWSNTYGEKAYFFRTLPVSEDVHMLSYIISFTIGVVVTWIVCLAALFYVSVRYVPQGWNELYTIFSKLGLTTNVLLILFLIISTVQSYLAMFFAEAIASFKPNHALLIGIVVYTVLMVATFWAFTQIAYDQSMLFEVQTYGDGNVVTNVSFATNTAMMLEIGSLATISFVIYVACKYLLRKKYNIQ